MTRLAMVLLIWSSADVHLIQGRDMLDYLINPLRGLAVCLQIITLARARTISLYWLVLYG